MLDAVDAEFAGAKDGKPSASYKFRFPGGGAMFPRDTGAYIDRRRLAVATRNHSPSPRDEILRGTIPGRPEHPSTSQTGAPGRTYAVRHERGGCSGSGGRGHGHASGSVVAGSGQVAAERDGGEYGPDGGSGPGRRG